MLPSTQQILSAVLTGRGDPQVDAAIERVEEAVPAPRAAESCKRQTQDAQQDCDGAHAPTEGILARRQQYQDCCHQNEAARRRSSEEQQAAPRQPQVLVLWLTRRAARGINRQWSAPDPSPSPHRLVSTVGSVELTVWSNPCSAAPSSRPPRRHHSQSILLSAAAST